MLPKKRLHSDLSKERFKEENVFTHSSLEQRNTEESCLKLFEKSETICNELDDFPVLNRLRTLDFLKKGLNNLSEGYACLDASRPWLVYWIVHSMELLDYQISDEEKSKIVNFLGRCQDANGGFAGGPGQLAHLAPTYAAVNALVILGSKEAYSLVDREKMVQWMDRLRCEDGAFRMHVDGELDIRGVYCALSVARLLKIYTPELFHNTDQWLLRCQSYEGGFGGVPGMEAHGGYSFCGLAALILMGKEKLCNLDTLSLWAASRQMRLEGGFQGRTNKLVDGCYSFWQGGLFPLLHKMISDTEDKKVLQEGWLFDQMALQEYLLICCQDPRGGLIDKPGKSRDFYHTCYTLSGLSVAQRFSPISEQGKDSLLVFGDPKNLLIPTHPIFNVCVPAAVEASLYFEKMPIPQVSSR